MTNKNHIRVWYSLPRRQNLTLLSNACEAAPRSLFWAPQRTQWRVLEVRVRISLQLACKNSRFSSLLAAGDVSRGGTSATPWQKFHTDDAKSVRNLVIRADWPYNKTVNICGIYSSLEEAFGFYWSSFAGEHIALPKRKVHKIEQIWIWNPMTTGFIM